MHYPAAALVGLNGFKKGKIGWHFMKHHEGPPEEVHRAFSGLQKQRYGGQGRLRRLSVDSRKIFQMHS